MQYKFLTSGFRATVVTNSKNIHSYIFARTFQSAREPFANHRIARKVFIGFTSNYILKKKSKKIYFMKILPTANTSKMEFEN